MYDSPRSIRFEQIQRITSLVEVDSYDAVRPIIESLEAGDYSLAAIFADTLNRDDRVAGDLQARLLGLRGKNLNFIPSQVKNSRQAVIQEQILKEVNEGFDCWFPPAERQTLHKYGLLLGFGLAEITWDTSTYPWIPNVRAWHPQYLRWDISKNRYVIYATSIDPDTQAISYVWIDLPDVNQNRNSDSTWVIYTPNGYNFSWLSGLLIPLSSMYLARQLVYRDWLRASEIDGISPLILKRPVSLSEDAITALMDSLKYRGSETIINLPQIDEGPETNIERLAPSAGTGDLFRDLASKVEASIGNILLGQSVSGEKPASIGSGQQNQDEQVRMDLLQADAMTMESVINDQILYWYYVYNYGEKCPKPKAKYLIKTEQQTQ